METSHWLISAGLVTSSIIAITANSFLLLIFCRRRGLRTVPNRFVINLLITNLLSCVLLIPFLIMDQSPLSPSNNQTSSALVLHEVHNGTDKVQIIETSEISAINNKLFPCYAAQVSTSFVCTLSIFSILLIGINQYFGVIHSLRYHFYINKCRSTIFLITSWVLALIFSVLSSVTESDSCLWRFCDSVQRTELSKVINSVYSVSYFVVVILAPFLAISVIYVCIYKAAHKNSERMRKSRSANFDACKEETGAALPKVRSAPNFLNFETLTTSVVPSINRTSSERTNNFITSLKYKISNASVFRYREETRAAKISVLVIFLVLFCYVPYGLILLLNSGLDVRTSQTLNYSSTVLLMLSTVISPFLFAYRNRRVKREIGKVFGLVPPKAPDRVSVRRRSDDHCRVPFLGQKCIVPEVIVTCSNERKSILKKMCQTSNWTSCKKCNFIAVPESCMSGEARGSFSSASTQTSNDDC